MFKCTTCDDEGILDCCKKLFCEICISGHLMQFTNIKHRPLPLNLNRDPNFVCLLQTRLSNEILELEEFKNASLRMISDYSYMLKKEIDDYFEQVNSQLLQKYRDVYKDLQTALTSLLINNAKSEVLELFIHCSSSEDIKNIALLNKSINQPTLTLKESLADLFKINLNFYCSEKEGESDPNTKENIPMLKNEYIAGSGKSSIILLPTNRPRAISQAKLSNETIFSVIPFSNMIKAYDIQEDTYAEITIESFKFPSKAAWSVTKDKRIVITGGFDDVAGKAAYVFSIPDRKSSELPKMLASRFNHAQITVDDDILVVGGMSKSALSECERYSFEKKKWVKFGNLVVSREFPSVCYSLGKIYVAGGTGIETIECALLTKKKFELLFIRLPGPGRCNFFVYENNFCLLHRGNYITINHQNMNFKVIGKISGDNFWTGSDYLTVEKYVYWVYDSCILQFDVSTGAIEFINDN